MNLKIWLLRGLNLKYHRPKKEENKNLKHYQSKAIFGLKEILIINVY